MAYYFAIRTGENEYNGLNVRKSGFFSETHNEKSSSVCSLEEIDDYTTKFLDEERIKYCLISEKILDIRYKENSLAIIDASKQGEEEVVDGILFKESKHLLQNPLLAIEYIKRLINDCGREDLKEMLEEIPTDLNQLDYKKLREIVLFIYRYENAPTQNRGISKSLKK